MANLTDTHNITLHKKHTFKDGRAYYSVPAFGDGNCALNVFALWMIDAIKRDDFVLDKEKQQWLMLYLTNETSLNALKERLKFYRGQPSTTSNARNPYADVANDLESFIQFIDRKPDQSTFAELHHYIRDQHSRHAIAALQVGLAPALRQLGVEAYLGELKDILHENDDSAHPMINDAISLFEDGTNAGQEVLSHLAHDFFGINLALYQADGTPVQTSEELIGFPTCAIMHSSDSSGHFDCLLPQDQVEQLQGIAAELPNQYIVDKLDDKIAKLKCKPYISKDEVAETASIVDEANDVINNAAEIHDIKKLAVLSARAVATVKNKLDVSDEKLKTVGVKLDLQIKLLQQDCLPVVADDMSTDEAIARTLQNAEILSFYASNHEALLLPTRYMHARGNRITSDFFAPAASWPMLFSSASAASTDACPADDSSLKPTS